jgi:hypothetical protein
MNSPALDRALGALDDTTDQLHKALTVLRALNPAAMGLVDRERVDAAKGFILAADSDLLVAQQAIRRARTQSPS